MELLLHLDMDTVMDMDIMLLRLLPEWECINSLVCNI
jgi:hypothetical protein